MDFPTTGILDAFTGADENPITTNWTTQLHSGHDHLRRVSNAMQGQGAGTTSSGWYDIAQYGPDSECYVTITALPDLNSQVRLHLRLKDLGGTVYDGYQLRLNRNAGAANDQVGIYRVDNAADTLLGAAVTQEFAAGDALGFEAIGSTLKGYHKPAAGSWTELLSRTDATYTAAGFVGVLTAEAATPIVLDDFGGGKIGADPLRSQHLDYDYSR